MRIGINYVMPHETPEQWAQMLDEKGYRATVFPVDYTAPVRLIDAYVNAAAARNILIAEVGIWKSPFQPDKMTSKLAKEYCLEQFKLADYVKAKCCVNVSGAVGDIWYFCYRENFSKATYDRNVEFIQFLCDTVNPKYTSYALEPMQWMVPSSVEQYTQLLKDVNRQHFKVHMDICNLVNSPYLFTHQDILIRQVFDILGKDIVSCHIKDIRLQVGTSVMIEETPLGTGNADLACYLQRIAGLDEDIPVLIEHLDRMEAYDMAFDYLKQLL